MLPQTPQQPRERTSPLFNDNRLKLGLFFMTVGGGPRPSWAEGRLPPIWSVMRDVTVLADQAGIDGLNLTFVNYEEGVAQLVSEILPLMEQAGLREPFLGRAGDEHARHQPSNTDQQMALRRR